MIKIGKKELFLEDIILFIYFAIMYAHNAPYPRLFTISSFAVASGYLLLSIVNAELIIEKERYRVLGWYILFAVYEYVVSTINSLYQDLLWNNVIQNILILFIMCTYVTSKEKFLRLLKIFAFSALYFGMVVWLTSPYSTWGTTDFVGITLSQRNTIAYIVGTGFILFMYFWLEEKKKIYIFYLLPSALLLLSLLDQEKA